MVAQPKNNMNESEENKLEDGQRSDAATCSVVTGSLDDLKQDFDQRLNNLSHKELVASFRAIGCEVEIAESISDESFSILAADDYEEYGDDPLY